jgi:hypothetical protein
MHNHSTGGRYGIETLKIRDNYRIASLKFKIKTPHFNMNYVVGSLIGSL